MCKYFVFLIIVVIFSEIRRILGFSNELTSRFCDRPLMEGTIIMGKKVALNDTSFVQIFRGELQLKNGDNYFPSEYLTVSAVPRTNEVIFEVYGGGIFSKGGCKGLRSTSQKSILMMPNAAVNVSVWAGWAKTYSSGVKITRKLTLFSVLSNSEEEISNATEL
mmetsp:Transcript_21091/g.21209  ORF Transcript_21091/g.21209 Transcript_21091/m.21209 type:complete len:163 (-) Transcript_21091:255-743(-)